MKGIKMALKNTNERYEYIYGSNARKLKTDAHTVQRRTGRSDKVRTGSKPRTKTRTQPLKRRARPAAEKVVKSSSGKVKIRKAGSDDNTTRVVVKTVRPVTERTIRRREQEKAARNAEVVARHKAWFLEFDWKYTVVVLTAVMLCFFACIFYVSEKAKINRMQQDIYDLKSENISLVGKKNALKAEVDKAINLEQVEDYAKKKLKMRYPETGNIIYYTTGENDYFRQYRRINTNKK